MPRVALNLPVSVGERNERGRRASASGAEQGAQHGAHDTGREGPAKEPNGEEQARAMKALVPGV